DVQSEGELGEGLFGEGEPGLEAAESPTKVAKEENKEGEADKRENDEPDAAETAKKVQAKAGEAKAIAPAMDALPLGLQVGEALLVGRKVLTVASVGDAV